jgi:hypothetical protein
MKYLAVLLPLLAATPAWSQEKPEETREVRIFLLDRTTPERALKDAAAVLTLVRKSGRGETYLFPRAGKEAAPAGADAAPGMIRGLVSTPYYVELDLSGAAPPARREETEKQPPEAGKGKDAPLPSAREILRRARKGTWFARTMPASAFSSPFTATVTIRLGSLTFTSEEFQGPGTGQDDPKEVAARVDRALETLRERTKEGVGFMDLRPLVVDLMRDLSKLAPAGFEDGSGVFEKDRQWCLALARGIEDACYRGDSGRIQELSQQCGPRLKEMNELLAKDKEKKEPEREPDAPSTVK